MNLDGFFPPHVALAALLAIGTIVAFVLTSFVEWFLHAKLLHGEEKECTRRFSNRHKKHHELHEPPEFVSIHKDETYGIAPAFLLGSIALLSLTGLIIGHFVSRPLLLAADFGFTAFVYFRIFVFVHRRVHEPKKDGWFEQTALFRHIQKHHHVHHARDDRNFCILLPGVADRTCGTLSGQTRPAKP